jgi:hypothetical protein
MSEQIGRKYVKARETIYLYCWKVLSLTQVYRCASERLQEGERNRINARFESSKAIEYTIEKNYDR